MARRSGPDQAFHRVALLGAVLLAAFLAAYGTLYLLTSSETGDPHQPIFSQVRLMVWFAVLLYGIVAAFAVLIAGIFAAHRVSRPLDRLDRMLEEAAAGGAPKEVRVREKDPFQPAARGQAALLSFLRARQEELGALGKRVGEECEELAAAAEKGDSQEWARRVKALRQTCAEIEAAASREGATRPDPSARASGNRAGGGAEKGMTLLELMVVLAIISVLSTPTGFLFNANQPPTLADAKLSGMAYTVSPLRDHFTLTALVNNRYLDPLVATPSGIEPSSYPH